MNERVKAYRERQKAAGLSQVSLWLDAPTVQLLKQATATQHRLPGEVIATALHTWWSHLDHSTPPVSAKEGDQADASPATTPETALLRELVHKMVQEALANTNETVTTTPLPSDPEETAGLTHAVDEGNPAHTSEPVATMPADPVPTTTKNHAPLPRPSLYQWPRSF